MLLILLLLLDFSKQRGKEAEGRQCPFFYFLFLYFMNTFVPIYVDTRSTLEAF